MRNIVIEHIKRRFESYPELLKGTPQELLKENLPIAKSKTLAAHIWCVVGARESFARAISEGAWAGFECSLKGEERTHLIEGLTKSAAMLEAAFQSTTDWTSERDELLAGLLEHEVMHEGKSSVTCTA